MREHYAKLGAAPAMHRVVMTGHPAPQINQLFGDRLVAWRVAGLPNPGEEAKSYLSGM